MLIYQWHIPTLLQYIHQRILEQKQKWRVLPLEYITVVVFLSLSLNHTSRGLMYPRKCGLQSSGDFDCRCPLHQNNPILPHMFLQLLLPPLLHPLSSHQSPIQIPKIYLKVRNKKNCIHLKKDAVDSEKNFVNSIQRVVKQNSFQKRKLKS